MMKKGWLLVFGLGILVLVAGLGFLLKVNLDKKDSILQDYRGLPRIDLILNETSLEEIGNNKEIKYMGNRLKVYNGEMIKDYDEVELKGRGNGTWVQEKKPYQIKFTSKIELLGMGKAKKWYLLANATDETNLRNDLSFKFAEMLGMEYVFRGQFVELYVNGEYWGLYYLTHAMGVEKTEVDLKDSLGILVELDNVYGDAETYYKTGNGDKLIIKDAVNESKKEIAMTDFLKKYNELEIAVKEKDFEKIKELIDIESFAKYFLLSEFTVNPDAYWTSFYFYKDGEEDKIHAGPGWDFDLAFANRNWGNWMGEEFYSPTRSMARKDELMLKETYEEKGLGKWYKFGETLSRIMFDLMDIPEFKEEVIKVFQERISGREQEFLSEGRRKAGEIYDAVIVDAKKWERKDFNEVVDEMFKWIEKRFEFFEEEYGNGNFEPLRVL